MTIRFFSHEEKQDWKYKIKKDSLHSEFLIKIHVESSENRANSDFLIYLPQLINFRFISELTLKNNLKVTRQVFQ